MSATANEAQNWTRWVPGLVALRQYQRAHGSVSDIVAGVVLTTLLVPVGVAYAVASGVPGIYGLYATIVPLLAYAVFGPSRILVLGPDSSLAPIILAVVLPLSHGDPMRAVALAGALAIVSGLVCVLAGVLRLGFITELLSKPIRYGYMNGIALTVLISQLPKLLGFSIDADGPLRSLWAIADAIWHGRINWAACLVGLATLATILSLRGHRRLPGVLIAVIGATVAVAALGLSERAGVAVLGPLPQGLPAFRIPWIDPADVVTVLIGGGAIALVSFADTSVLSRAYAQRLGQHGRSPTRRWWGWGAANLAAGFFPGLPHQQQCVAHACGRGIRGEDADDRRGGRAGRRLVASRHCPASLLQYLPSTALAAVVIASALGLIEITDLRRIFRIQSLGGLAVGRLLRRCRGPGHDPGHRACHRDRRRRIPVGRLATAFGGAWPPSRCRGLSTTSRAIPMPASSPAWCCFVGMRRSSSPTPIISRAGSYGGRSGVAHASAPTGGCGGRAGDQRRRHRG